MPWVFLLLVVTVGGVPSQPVLAGDTLYEPSLHPDRINLTWSGDPATTQAVSWRTSVTGNPAMLELALAGASPDFRNDAASYSAVTEDLDVDGVQASYHSVELTGLTPSTLYAYRVGDGEAWSEWFHFRTAAAQSASFSFIYFGDAQNEVRSMWSRVIRQAYSSLPDAAFMLHAGDLVNHASSDKEWGEWFAAGGWVNGSLPNIATPGNHEYDGRQLAPQWRAQFALPLNGPEPGGDLDETVYYIDYQGVRIVSLDTNRMISRDSTRVQADWLRAVLSDNPNRWTIVTHHYPMFAAARGRIGYPPLNSQLRPIYEAFGVDLVLQGHDHTYARGDFHGLGGESKAPDARGPVYVVSVSGPKMYDPKEPWWADVSLGNTQMYQLIHVDGNQLRYEAYTATGELFDAFELAKRADGSSRLVQSRLDPNNIGM